MKKNVLITGASGNLGKATVEKFLKEGYHVIITVTPGHANTDVENDVDIMEADLTNEEQTNNAVMQVVTKYQRIDVALLLVGGFTAGGIKDTDGDALNKMISLNFNTAYYVARPVFLQMQSQVNGGRIVLVGSRPALVPKEGKNVLAYALAKSLLFRLAEFLNAEGSSSNVVTSVIVPGTIDTPANRKAMPDKNFSDWVAPEEIATALEFLSSGNAKSLRESVIKIFGNS